MNTPWQPQPFWNEDVWFRTWQLRHLTPEFEAWWLGFYGSPLAYEASGAEQHEYFARAGFALSGWRAREAAAAAYPFPLPAPAPNRKSKIENLK